MSGLVRLVLLDSAAWVVISAIIGAAAALLPDRWLDRDSALTRPRGWERNGRTYRKVLHIHRWKDRLPEVNGWGPGRRASKKHLAGRAAVAPLLRETRRAEYVHVAIAAAGVSFAWWNPWWLALLMVGFGVVANAPFIAVQRYNRARLLGLRAARPTVPV